MDSRRIFVQFLQLLQRHRGQGGWVADAINAAWDAHEPSEDHSQIPDNKLQSLIDQAYVIGDAAQWSSLCEIAYDRMTTHQLHVGNVATAVMNTLFQPRQSGRQSVDANFIPPNDAGLTEIAAAVFDLVEMVAARSNRG